jgi:hypothetical protein
MRCPSCGGDNPAGTKFCIECGIPLTGHTEGPPPHPLMSRPQPLLSYTPSYLAEKILTSKSAREGERKQVRVLFADLKGAMELLADRDPEEARALLDPLLERMMEAVHRYEGTVNQVLGDGIMALFGAPIAHEDRAVRACYTAHAMQDAICRYKEVIAISRMTQSVPHAWVLNPGCRSSWSAPPFTQGEASHDAVSEIYDHRRRVT